MKYYSNEIVFRGHPDKVCDQISARLLQEYVNGDVNTRAGIEVCGGKGTIFITGEVTSNAEVDVVGVTKRVLQEIGYNQDYNIINNIGKQSQDISIGIDNGGAGDQGMMFGYACDDTDYFLPKAMIILQKLAVKYDELVHSDSRFLPDGKAQITGIYNDNFKLIKIKNFVISYQNTEQERQETDKLLIDLATDIALEYNVEIEKFHINPTGKFLIGGFDGDAGLTGRKIVVDAYQSFANVGGGCMNGKDITKVDFSAAHMARRIAVNMLRKNNLKWCEVQISYAIGIAEPLAIYIDSDLGFIEPNQELYNMCKPNNIKLLMKPSEVGYEELARFGHFGINEFKENYYIEQFKHTNNY